MDYLSTLPSHLIVKISSNVLNDDVHSLACCNQRLHAILIPEKVLIFMEVIGEEVSVSVYQGPPGTLVPSFRIIDLSWYKAFSDPQSRKFYEYQCFKIYTSFAAMWALKHRDKEQDLYLAYNYIPDNSELKCIGRSEVSECKQLSLLIGRRTDYPCQKRHSLIRVDSIRYYLRNSLGAPKLETLKLPIVKETTILRVLRFSLIGGMHNKLCKKAMAVFDESYNLLYCLRREGEKVRHRDTGWIEAPGIIAELSQKKLYYLTLRQTFIPKNYGPLWFDLLQEFGTKILTKRR